MKTLKTTSKSKGFTLIELMVVISIIALLSSVVLASLKGAREKAQITKTVAEMKSLQQALELYRNKFGVYPNPTYTSVGDDEQKNYDNGDAYDFLIGFDSFVQTNLVAYKFISKVPHAPNYPNNCNSDCSTNGNVLSYSTTFGEPYTSYFCGNQKAKNYIIVLMTKHKVNLPPFTVYDNNNQTSQDGGYGWYHNGLGLNEYCLTM